MIASKLIVDSLPPLKPSETLYKASLWMSEFKVSHLPVVGQSDFFGILSEEDIIDFNGENETIESTKIQLHLIFAYEHEHIFEVMQKMSDNQLTIMPILDSNDNYVGATTLPNLMTVASNITSIKEPGGVIVLKMNSTDYSLAEIAQIVEGNNARILSSYITSSHDTTEIEVTIKINKKELGAILQTFSRYDYNVIESYHKEEDFRDIKNRFDNLMDMLDL